MTQLLAFRAATLLLYLGPLLAGLGGQGWGLVPAFVVIFAAYLLVVRTSLFPRGAGDWGDGALMRRLAVQVLGQVLVIVLCLAIGRGLGGVTGMLHGLGAGWALSVSFLAVPLSRLLAVQPGARS